VLKWLVLLTDMSAEMPVF